jgi:apolipoprotein N-acyltransferase
VFGGSLWILISNVLAFLLVVSLNRDKVSGILRFSLWVIVLVLPVIISLVLYVKSDTKGHKQIIVKVIQPNINPYTDKFNGLTNQQQLNRILHLADSVNSSSVCYYIAPETSIDNSIWEENIANNSNIIEIRNFLKKHPDSKFVIGAITYKHYNNRLEATTTSNKMPDNKQGLYDIYNSALFIDTSCKVQIYHKSKLIIGVEKIPYIQYLKPIEKYLFNVGGESVCYGSQTDRTVFVSESDSVNIAPIICYESIYGEFITGSVKKGAGVIFIITNDGWWNHSSEYAQHNNLARLRAIETRRSIARSANTGRSSVINQRGDIVNYTLWDTQTVMLNSLNYNTATTFYVKHGDYIGRYASVIAILLLCTAFAKRYLNRRSV